MFAQAVMARWSRHIWAQVLMSSIWVVGGITKGVHEIAHVVQKCCIFHAGANMPWTRIWYRVLQ